MDSPALAVLRQAAAEVAAAAQPTAQLVYGGGARAAERRCGDERLQATLRDPAHELQRVLNGPSARHAPAHALSCE